MARPELPGAAAPHSAACFSISVGGSHPLFQSPAKNALLFFVWLWYIGLRIVKAALKSSIFLFFLEQLCYFNLSPQGDGNHKGLNNMAKCARFQLIPARGRKLRVHAQLWHSHADFNLSPQGDGNMDLSDPIEQPHSISTYPRKGAETLGCVEHIATSILFQLIPARGRKHQISWP